jgi:hypothetical protein
MGKHIYHIYKEVDPVKSDSLPLFIVPLVFSKRGGLYLESVAKNTAIDSYAGKVYTALLR